MITEREYILWVLHDLAVRIGPMDRRMKKIISLARVVLL